MAHSVKGFSLSWPGGCGRAGHLELARREREGEKREKKEKRRKEEKEGGERERREEEERERECLLVGFLLFPLLFHQRLPTVRVGLSP